eukprot:10617128-Lingulodinium_polyedra.AAC.1
MTNTKDFEKECRSFAKEVAKTYQKGSKKSAETSTARVAKSKPVNTERSTAVAFILQSSAFNQSIYKDSKNNRWQAW